MKLSVITVCYNSAATIGYTLESFCRQDYPDKELLVIDGASKDATLSVVDSFQCNDIRVVSEPDNGLYDAMNKGLDNYAGDAVGFLNSDDRYADEGVLSAIAAALQASDIVFGDLDFVDDHDQSAVVRRWRGSPYRPGAFRRGWMPAHPTFYARRRVVEATGRFELSYRIAADYDFMLRALELNSFTARYLRRVQVKMMAGGTSNAGVSAYLKSNFEALKSRRARLHSGAIDYALFAKPLMKAFQFDLSARSN